MTQRQFVAVLIITFLVVVIWIVSDIIHARPSETLNPKVKTLLDPINPNFDKAILDQVKNVGKIEPLKESSKSSTVSTGSAITR